MTLVEIDADGRPAASAPPLSDAAREVCDAHVALYAGAGFVRPWIGYLRLHDGVWVGAGGFKGPPHEGRIEIAYFTFPAFEGRGHATATARELLRIARAVVPAPRITARTLPAPGASTRILAKLGFECVGTVDDPDDGPVWEWHAAAA